VTDISWKKINHTSDILELGQNIKVKVLKFDEEITRLSLGIKQLTDNPWENVKEHFEINNDYECSVSNINDLGVSLSMNTDHDGFIPTNELSWLKKPPHPSKIVQVNDKLKIRVLEIDDEKSRLVCSLKQLKNNPWDNIKKEFNVGDVIETEIVNRVDFGIFVKVFDEIDGMIHVSDLHWDEKESAKMLNDSKKGEKISVKILEIDIDKERISLGVKHLTKDPTQEFINNNPVKSVVSGKIKSIDEKGITILLEEGIFGFMKKSNLAKDRSEQKVERFAIDEMVDSMIIAFDQSSRKIDLSIKNIEIEEEKSALTKYGSKDSGASLGDILGSALDKKEKS
jgi:small subunit ribosomal protein S1